MTTIRLTMVFLGLVASAPAFAAIYKVGNPTDTQCTHATIAAAIAAAASNPGADTIRIATNLNYTNLALTISSNDDLELIGGVPGLQPLDA